MNETDIKKIYSKKIKLFKKYNQFYYDKSSPAITDHQFDILKNEIIELEKKHYYLKDENSPNISVGFKPSKKFQKIKHKVTMLSLGNNIN